MDRNKFIGAILAILLFTCLAPMPYGYFQLIRLVALFAFTFFSYTEFKNGRKSLGITFFALAVLFQPFIKIALGRDIWNSIDIIVGIGLLVYAFNLNKK